MNTYTFLKKDGAWQLIFRKPHTAKKVIKTLTDGSNSMLNLLANGGKEITLRLTKEPFENATVLELLQPCQPFLEGGYYLLRQFNGQEINFRMWVSDVTKYIFGKTPERIYVSPVNPQKRTYPDVL